MLWVARFIPTSSGQRGDGGRERVDDQLGVLALEHVDDLLVGLALEHVVGRCLLLVEGLLSSLELVVVAMVGDRSWLGLPTVRLRAAVIWFTKPMFTM